MTSSKRSETCLNVLPQSNLQELACFSPEEMQGKTIKMEPGQQTAKGAKIK
jgi:hypothetical protein